MNNIKILDCTLRDGGYVNNWNFNDSQISKIISSLEKSNIDIIECGYLSENGKNKDSTQFSNLNILDKFINKKNEKVIMINYGDYNVLKLPNVVDSCISGIRFAFHKKDLEKAFDEAKIIIEKGYDLYFQPMITKNYDDLEFLNILKKVNLLKPKAFYIVDSFGSMTLKEFSRYLNLSDNNLNTDISLGYHSHNNMQLAFSNAISLCNANLSRRVIIDSSIYGIGRGAGNLNSELIIDYLNKTFGINYKSLPLLEIIDEFLNSLMREKPWGFSPAQFLSASFNCHPNYANYLINKNTNHITEISNLLSKIPLDKKNSFDKAFIEKLYFNNIIQKSPVKNTLDFNLKKKVLLIASGTSVHKYYKLIEEKVKNENYFTVSLNHKSLFETDLYFFTNQKRYDEFSDSLIEHNVLISSNIKKTSHNKNITVFDINNMGKLDDTNFSNVALIAINTFFKNGFESIEIAGLDGYSGTLENYNYTETNQILDKESLEYENQIIKKGLKILNEKISIQLITPSIFKEDIKLRIIGVIPARYKSSRFEGKPLTLIKNIPMVKRTYEQAKKSKLLDELVVATESEKIFNYCKSENIPVLMTSDACLTGTDRIAEVALEKNFDLYVNIQGDEPVIDPISIDEVVSEYKRYKDKYIAYNLYKTICCDTEIKSDTIIKTIVNEKDELMYMSRLNVPFNKSNLEVNHKKQVCVYGFTKKALELFSSRNKTINEQYEDIEILRFLDIGEKVKMTETKVDSIAVDIPSDVLKVEAYLEENGLE